MTPPTGDDGSWSYRNGCEKKKTYRSRSVAKQEAKIRRPGRPQKLWAYACPHCPGWHLSSRPPRDVTE